jgi:hypothetical protein
MRRLLRRRVAVDTRNLVEHIDAEGGLECVRQPIREIPRRVMLVLKLCIRRLVCFPEVRDVSAICWEP